MNRVAAIVIILSLVLNALPGECALSPAELLGCSVSGSQQGLSACLAASALPLRLLNDLVRGEYPLAESLAAKTSTPQPSQTPGEKAPSPICVTVSFAGCGSLSPDHSPRQDGAGAALTGVPVVCLTLLSGRAAAPPGRGGILSSPLLSYLALLRQGAPALCASRMPLP
jgi:hypothetical protein